MPAFGAAIDMLGNLIKNVGACTAPDHAANKAYVDAQVAGVSGGSTPIGPAGGDLTGTYPNPTIGAGKVTSAAIANGAVDTGDLSSSVLQLMPPTGSILPFAGSSAGASPQGWFWCNGQTVSRTTYPALYAICGILYGAGDGSTTFNLPDLRHRVVWGAGSVSALASNDGVAEASRTIVHAHALGGHHHGTGSLVNASQDLSITSNTQIGGTANRVTQQTHNHAISGSTGTPDGPSDNNAANSLPFLSLNYIIKS